MANGGGGGRSHALTRRWYGGYGCACGGGVVLVWATMVIVAPVRATPGEWHQWTATTEAARKAQLGGRRPQVGGKIVVVSCGSTAS
uniref:Uncharacterized protein n=1 Tax=Arundo donax TaxID=35708 RepID=A0A0A8ZS98_ARUDO